MSALLPETPNADAIRADFLIAEEQIVRSSAVMRAATRSFAIRSTCWASRR